MSRYGPPPDNEVDKKVYELLFDDFGQTSVELFIRSDLTIGEIQGSLVRLFDAKLVDRVVSDGQRSVYWSRNKPPDII